MQKFSVFLTPSPEDFAWAENLIRQICGKFDQPPFEPHVTVYSAALSGPGKMITALSGAVEGMRPFSLRITGIGCSEEYFKALFIRFEEHHLLREISEKMRTETETDSGYVLVPHLSLLYGDMQLRDKSAAAKRVVLDKTSILFDEVKIVTPRNVEKGWRDPGQWQTLFRVRLGKGQSGQDTFQ